MGSEEQEKMEIVVVAGLSGAGKSTVIKALEDCGFYPLDHLPADTLPAVLGSLSKGGHHKAAVGLDAWDPHFLENFSDFYKSISQYGQPRLLLLQADNEELLRRFGENRRRHPLTAKELSLPQAIEMEKAFIDKHSRLGHSIDTTGMSSNTLKAYVKNFLDLKNDQMDICIESFGFKHGAPSACDLVYDVRCLPNPYYNPELRPMSGLDEPVRAFFAQKETPAQMAKQIAGFIAEWKPHYERDHRSYLNVGVGCTGGQHRSVYVASQVQALLAEMGIGARVRHREEARWGARETPQAAAKKSPRP